MKQTEQKKPKVFRTLIRLIHNDGKTTGNYNQVSISREKAVKRPR